MVDIVQKEVAETTDTSYVICTFKLATIKKYKRQFAEALMLRFAFVLSLLKMRKSSNGSVYNH